MAGKTFHGIGGIEDEAPPLGPDGAAPDSDDIRGVYSGPTVVDDDKVAAGLERLRALEMPAGPLDGSTELVADASSSEPTRIGPPIMPRPTAVGRSMPSNLPPPEAMLPPLDPLRGTMFGHTVHLPDLHLPVDAEDTSSPSGPIYTPPSPAQAAPTTQMVRYDPRATLYDGGQPPYPDNASGNTPYPRSAQPLPLEEMFPAHERDLPTENIPPLHRKPVVRFMIGVALLAALGGSTYTFMRQRVVADEEIIPSIPVAPPSIGIELQAPPPAPPPAAAAPAAAETAPTGSPAAATPPPTPGAARPPAAAASPTPSRAPAAVEARAEAEPRPARSDAAPERPRASRSERRRTSSPASTASPEADTEAAE